MRTKTVLLAAVLLLAPASVGLSADFEDSFEVFNRENWTKQFGGIRMADEPVPKGVTIREGVCVLNEPLQGLRITSRRKFLYGTFEARVKIKPRGLQYIGFMSRQPWGANTAMCMSVPDGSGWRLVLARDTPSKGLGVKINQGRDVALSVSVRENQWCTLRIVWEARKIEFHADGKRIGVVTDESLIPQEPTPLILDQVAGSPMEVDWIRVTDTKILAGQEAGPPPVPAVGPTVTLESDDWRVVVDQTSGLIRRIENLKPRPLRWTPENAGGIDVYIRSWPRGRPVRLRATARERHAYKDTFACVLQPEDPPFRDMIQARYEVKLDAEKLTVSSVFTATEDIDQAVEIGLGLPFSPDRWRRQIFAHCPWLALSPRQERAIRFPFLADPNDATVASNVGNWVFYPMGLLDGDDRIVFWGGMDLGRRVVLAPNNYGSVPAITLAPKRWSKGETKTLQFTLKSFPKPANGLADVLRWYLSNCRSSDPLTQDLFPVKEWTARIFAQGGGVGMPDVRITYVNPKAKRAFFDRVTDLLKRYHVNNLWLGSYHRIDGSYPTSGRWLTITGMPISAEAWRAEVQRLKRIGLRPCLYAFQFICPELLTDGGVPDRRWVLHGTDGKLSAFDSYTAGDPHGADWFTKELAAKLGTNKLTWADADFGNDAFRKWYTEQLKAAIDYYQPSGISFDYGWSILGPYSAWSPSNPKTSLPHARLRVQADIRRYIKAKYPHMQIIINCIPGSPSQLFADCMLLENSHVMSDLDFAAGKALGSAMSSMDYFADHDRQRWTRQMMLDLARGCSFGAPFWILTSAPEADYIATWKTFLDFSGRATRLPLLPRQDAVTSTAGGSDIIGTVWSDGKELMAAAFDRRSSGTSRDLAISLAVPDSIADDAKWKLSRLNNMNVRIADCGWQVQARRRGRLVLSGPLAPGEMILVEKIR